MPKKYKIKCEVERDGKLQLELERLRRRVAELEGLELRHKETEETLRKSEDQLRLITDALPVFIAYIDSRMCFRFGNRTCEAWLGRSRADLYGISTSEILGESTYEAVKDLIEDALCGRMISYEGAIAPEEGLTCYISAILIPHMGNKGEIEGVVVLITDITKRKIEAKAIEQDREHLSTIIDGSPMATFVIDRDHRIVLWNRACAALTDIPREEILGRRLDLSPLDPGEGLPVLADLILDMTDDQIMQRYGRNVIRKDGVHNESFRMTRRIRVNGEEKLLAMQAIRLRDHNGEVAGAIQCAHDITEQERLERHLRQVQKMEAIGTLAGGIAHDFNNILMILTGYADMALRKVPEDSPVKGYLDQMLKAGNRGRDLVQQILAFSRKSEQERRPIELSPIVKESLKLLRASLPSTIEIRRNIDPEAGMALADPIQIHQVLMNLCANAAHAMQDKGGTLEVGLDSTELNARDAALYPDLEPGSFLRLTVKDSGHGISPEIADRIFDPFFTTKELGEGTGMGLAVVHGIVQSHSGAIVVESQPGTGTTFEVLFPKIIPEKNREYEGYALIPAGTERILLVDDEEDLVHAGSQMLENLGYKVTGRRDGIDAVETFRRQPDAFDLVITDQSMPRMTGIELAGELRRIREDIPIILCTGSTEQTDLEKIVAPGIRELVVKPVTVREMAHAIRKVLDSTGS